MAKNKLLILLSLIYSIGFIYPFSGYCGTDLSAVTQAASNVKDSVAPLEEKAAPEKGTDPAQTQFVQFIFGNLYSLVQGRGIHIDKNTILGNAETPEWVQRIQFGIDAGTNQETRYYFETVQPLYQDIDKQNTIFIAPRYSFAGHDGTYNIGTGYRRLLFDNSVLLGINSFWDATTDHDHFRMGLGGEAFVNVVELRANGYFAFSPRRQVNETLAWITYEKAVSGFDLEAGAPVPYLNWIRCYGGAYRWDYKQFKDKTGWTIRIEVKPLKFGTVNFIAYEDSKLDHAEFEVDGRISIPFELFYDKKYWKDVVTLGISKTPYPKKVDHSKRVLDRVERKYTIEVEKYMVSKLNGAIIEIRKGN